MTKKTMMQKIGSGAAAAVIAGTLSAGMGLQAAAPAQAVLPVIPLIPILGGTVAAGGITVGGMLANAGITLATVGLGLAITRDGAFDWFKDLPNWFAPKTDDTGAPVDKSESNEYVPVPSREGTADPLFYDYVWTDSRVSITKQEELPGYDTVNVIRSTFSIPVTKDSFNVRALVYATVTCRHATDAAAPLQTGSAVIEGGIAQPVADYETAFIDVRCAAVGIGNTVVGFYNVVELTISPVTTRQKEAYMAPPDPVVPGGMYDQFRWAPTTTHWRSKAYAAADPQYRTEVICVSPEGVRTTLSASTDITDAGLVNVPACSQLGEGYLAESLVVGFADGDRIRQPIFTATPAQPDQYMECDPVFGKMCKFQIYVDGQPCVVGSPACASWAGLHKVNPARVQCMWGTKAVDMSGCAILEGAYIYGGTPGVRENIDGNPDTWKVPGTVPGWQPHIETPTGPQPDPNPGPQTNPDPAPAPDISTAPAADPAPGPGTDPGTVPGATAMPTTGINPDAVPGPGGENCLGSGWSWNPVSWVMVPVQCALQWAFVPPKLRVDAAVEAIRPKLEARGIQPFVMPVLSGVSGLGGGGCAGPGIDLSAIKLPTLYPFSACTAPMSTIATGVSAFFSLAIVIQGGMSCIRGVASAFGFNWGLGSKSEADA
jgi:hypothetical protein